LNIHSPGGTVHNFALKSCNSVALGKIKK